MAGVELKKFKPVEFQFGQVHVRGGHCGKFTPIATKTVRCKDSSVEERFVKLVFTDQWLIGATTGTTKYTASSFGRTSLLQDLRAHVERLCDGEEPSETPDGENGEEAEVQDEDYDPMAEIEQNDGVHVDRTKVAGVSGVKRTRYYKNHVKNTVVTVNMPMRCPEQDPNCTDIRRIRLFIEDRRQLWLHITDVPWALQYLYVQNVLKGVPMVHPDSAGPGGA